MRQSKTLREHLFEQMEAIRNSTGENLKEELEKAPIIIDLAQSILSHDQTQLDMMKTIKELGIKEPDFIDTGKQLDGSKEDMFEHDSKPLTVGSYSSFAKNGSND